MKTIFAKSILCISLIICFLELTAQEFSTLDHTYLYFFGTSEPESGWYLPGYDDSGWDAGTGIIGYGYYSEGSAVENILAPKSTSSLYLRGHFHIDDVELWEEANFFADYDDGFIAYLNGHEIIRVNVERNVQFPAHNDLAVRSHEMQVYGWDRYPVLGYYLDSLQLDSILVEGDNIIAVQVLNDSINGSDLQFQGALRNITKIDYFIYSWDSRYKRQYNPDSTSLPIVKIETDEFGLPYKNIRRNAFMGIIKNGEGIYNKPGDSCNVYYGNVNIEVRGESSSEFPKRSYRFEFIDEMGKDSNVSVFGMPADDDWILLGPFHDKSLFRNPMVLDMAHKLDGSWQPRNKFCEVYFNGEYVGVYSFIETIKRNDDRVNIARLRPEETSGLDLTGGYIVRWDKDNTSDIEVVYPKSDNIVQEQTDYIHGYYDEYLSTLFGSNFLDQQTGYRNYINDTSLVDYIIVNEITKNADSYLYSTYFYKDRNDRDPRFHFGPIWDMNLAFGNSRFQRGDRYDEWQFANSSNNRLRIVKLFQDTALVDLFQERWWAAREGVFHTDSLIAYIDSMAAYLEEARIRNYEVWPVIAEDIFFPNYHSLSYEQEINNIKDWLISRLDWMDDNIDDIYYELKLPTIIPNSVTDLQFDYELYPNPFMERFVIEAKATEPAVIQVQVFDMAGVLKYQSLYDIQPGNTLIEIKDNETDNMPAGIYLLRIAIDGNPFATQKLIKN